MTEQVLTTDEDNYIIMTVDEIVDRLRAERDECHETNKLLRAQRDQLLAALSWIEDQDPQVVDAAREKFNLAER